MFVSKAVWFFIFLYCSRSTNIYHRVPIPIVRVTHVTDNCTDKHDYSITIIQTSRCYIVRRQSRVRAHNGAYFAVGFLFQHFRYTKTIPDFFRLFNNSEEFHYDHGILTSLLTSGPKRRNSYTVGRRHSRTRRMFLGVAFFSSFLHPRSRREISKRLELYARKVARTTTILHGHAIFFFFPNSF